MDIFVMDISAIGEKIRLRREELQLSQEELSEKADISPQHLSRLECNHKVPKLATLLSIAVALDTSLDGLLANKYTPYSELDKILSDCSAAEKSVILDTANALKQSLRTHS